MNYWETFSVSSVPGVTEQNDGRFVLGRTGTNVKVSSQEFLGKTAGVPSQELLGRKCGSFVPGVTRKIGGSFVPILTGTNGGSFIPRVTETNMAGVSFQVVTGKNMREFRSRRQWEK